MLCFVEYAFQNESEGIGVVYCPCGKCLNVSLHDMETVTMHIVQNGFVQGYTLWHLHGERRKRSREDQPTLEESGDDIKGMIQDACRYQFHSEEHSEEDDGGPSTSKNIHGRGQDFEKFEKLTQNAKKPLYPGCLKFSKLSFIV